MGNRGTNEIQDAAILDLVASCQRHELCCIRGMRHQVQNYFISVARWSSHNGGIFTNVQDMKSMRRFIQDAMTCLFHGVQQILSDQSFGPPSF